MNANDLSNLRMRCDILDAQVAVLDDPARLWAVLAATDGDEDVLVAAIGEAYGLGVHGAHAVLTMQVRTFSTARITVLRAEHAAAHALLSRLEE